MKSLIATALKRDELHGTHRLERRKTSPFRLGTMDHFSDQPIAVGPRLRWSPDLEAGWIQVAIRTLEREHDAIVREILLQQKRGAGVVDSGFRRSVRFPDDLIAQITLHF